MKLEEPVTLNFSDLEGFDLMTRASAFKKTGRGRHLTGTGIRGGIHGGIDR